MPNDLQYAAPTDSNGNPFVGGVDPATGHLHPLEGGTTTAITGSPTSATAIRLVTETKDGGDAALGATTDAAVTSNATGTISAKLRGLVAILADVWDSVNHRVKVDGSSVTQPVSAASLPLPTGAATAAKQPALGTAGSASADVISIQGVASMTAVKVDGSAVTQPVSGTVTANAGTNLNTSALALETGGNLATAATNTTGLNNTVGTAAAAIPSKLVQIGGSDGTNARAVKTNSSGQLDVRPLTSSDQITTVPSGTQTVSGTVTANAGTNLNTSALALESGGHLAAVDTSNAAIQTATGAQADAAWSGSGSGGIIGILKAVYAKVASMLTAVNAFTDGSASGSITAANVLGTTSNGILTLVTPLTFTANSATYLACPGGQGTAIMQLSGTFVGTVLFYGSPDGGLTWMPLAASSTSSAGVVSLAVSGTAPGAYRANIAGYTHVAAVCSAYTSGTITTRINLSAEPHNVVVNNATVLGQATMANSAPVVLASDEVVPVQGKGTEVAGQGPGVVNGTSTDLIPSTDVTGYRWLSLQTTGTFSLTLQIQGSNDNATWVVLQYLTASSITPINIASAITASGIWTTAITTRYIRVRCTAFTSNASLVGTLELFSTPPGALLLTTVLTTQTVAQTSGGLGLPFHLVSANTTNVTNVKASAGQVYKIRVSNTNAAFRYLKFHNTAGTPTAGSGVVAVVAVPPNTCVVDTDGFGDAFGTGIGISTVTGSADSDATAVGTGDLIIDIYTK